MTKTLAARLTPALLALTLAALAACGTGAAQGDATDNGAHARIKVGFPF